ncbi:MAG: efflux transporter periplasmic adaptor subunit [Stappia sp.]|uniref:efflux RND transporter periplasmic adaptor subunit n=1 Tax=Stappia sp. TaxID=1870903 RepID=UPI000C688A92|nr:efflux RND transporter periplasmic adaptor subunit [Stappia sp.]MAA97714.1 efflux transporter periplasmic adaptor subunit [Stappia sp.]MBM20670.1 efflux transporter periplasmic adaptor subunit [Stappia sp.]
MNIRFSHLLAVGISVGVAAWMWSGTYVEGGRADAADATPPPAKRAAEAAEKPFRVAVRDLVAEPRVSVLAIRGRTEAEATVDVRAETNGRVTERPVQEGQRVEKGDLLCRIESGAREAKVLEARALLAQAELDHSAATQLQGKGFTAQTRVAALKASMDAAQARLEEAEFELSRTSIKAPIGGVVISPLVEVGTMLSPGQTCATVIDVQPMLMIGQVSEREVAKLSIGDEATITLVSGDTVQGTLRYVAPAADSATRTFRIEIEIPNPDRSLREGLTATARVPLTAQPAHHVSSGILTLNDKGEIGVRTVDEDGKVRFMPVALLGGDDTGVWLAGLPDKVRVIVAGQDYVVEGQTVEAVVEQAEAEG